MRPMRRRSAAIALAAATLLLALAPAAFAASTLSVGVADVTATSARVTWSRTHDWCFITYDVQYREAGGTSWITAGSVDNATVQEFTITGLKPATAYEARVLDTDCGGSAGSNAAPFTTSASTVVPGVSNTALVAAGAFAALLIVGVFVGRARKKSGPKP